MSKTQHYGVDVEGKLQTLMSRRRFVRQGLATSVVGAVAFLNSCRKRVPTGLTPSSPFSERHAGDPEAPVEELAVDLSRLQEQFELIETIGQRKAPESFARTMLNVARMYIGVSRASDPKQVNHFLQLFGLGLRYTQGSYVPFCAAGVSFAACQAYCLVTPSLSFSKSQPNKRFRELIPTVAQHYFKPHPACRIIYQDALERKTWLPATAVTTADLMPGWLIFFDWRTPGSPNHVGIVEGVTADQITTIEFNTSSSNNTNGGSVARRVRPFDGVMGFVRTY